MQKISIWDFSQCILMQHLMIFPSKLHEYGASVHSLLEFSLSLKRQSASISLFLVQYFDEENEITKQDSTWYHSMPTRADQLYQTCSLGTSTYQGLPTHQPNYPFATILYPSLWLLHLQSLDKIKKQPLFAIVSKTVGF